MHKYFNSIITCHRNRRWALRVFLKAFSLAAPYIDKDSFEIVITDMDRNSDSLINKYKDVLNINHCKVKYDGIFWRSKSLNHAVLNAKGKFITILDIDAIITKYFLSSIVEFYNDFDKEMIKLNHRIKKLDKKSSSIFFFTNFDESLIESIIKNYDKFDINLETYTENAIIYRRGKIDKKWLEGKALGTSQFTMLKSIFMELGGYDERFIGWGFEDTDFNRRAYKFLGGGYLRPNPKYVSYHLANTGTNKNYKSKKIYIDNESLYLQNKKDNIISLPISSQWGKF